MTVVLDPIRIFHHGRCLFQTLFRCRFPRPPSWSPSMGCLQHAPYSPNLPTRKPLTIFKLVCLAAVLLAIPTDDKDDITALHHPAHNQAFLLCRIFIHPYQPCATSTFQLTLFGTHRHLSLLFPLHLVVTHDRVEMFLLATAQMGLRTPDASCSSILEIWDSKKTDWQPVLDFLIHSILEWFPAGCQALLSISKKHPPPHLTRRERRWQPSHRSQLSVPRFHGWRETQCSSATRLFPRQPPTPSVVELRHVITFMLLP